MPATFDPSYSQILEAARFVDEVGGVERAREILAELEAGYDLLSQEDEG